MRQELTRLRRGAVLVERDLSNTLNGEWSCSISDDYVMTVTSPQGEEQVLLDSEMNENHLTPSDLSGMSPQEQEATLDDDGIEVVGEEVQEVLRYWGIDWPVCRDHNALLTSCSGVWTCSTAIAHDSGDVGNLTVALVARPDASLS